MRLRTLDRKLLRDLWRLRGQMIAIALVIGAGVAMYVLMLSTFDSLQLTRETYYERSSFGDVFASLTRAPLWLEEEIAEIPGVSRMATRVVRDVNLDVPGMEAPATGHLVSIPADRRPAVCDLYIRSGRYLDPGRSDEVILSEDFANAHGLGPGDSIRAVINGRLRALSIVGLALSPEFIYSIAPGEIFPDPERYGILWMERRSLAAAFDMEGGFNDVVLTLTPTASVDEVIDRLDHLLSAYGGQGAIPRKLQISHWYLQNELNSLLNMGQFVPIVFLAVAAFLLNVVLSRIVNVEREQIAVIKALGYSDRAAAAHYLELALADAVAGIAVGVAAGAWLGLGMARMYSVFFHFPFLRYTLPPEVFFEAAGIALAAAAVGVLGAVRRALSLPPAEAMRPEAPARFRESLIERWGIKRWLSQPARIILRTLQRHPGRAALSVIGVAAAGGLMVFGTFWGDAIRATMEIQFDLAQRFDLAISFVEPASPGALDEVRRLPGVLAAEPYRSVPARLRRGHRERHTGVTGIPAESRLTRVIDASRRPVLLPPSGLVVSRKLAELLGAEVGDELTVEVLEGRRPVVEVPIQGLVDDSIGINAYMDISALRRLMEEGEALSGAYLLVDRAEIDRLYYQLKNTPAVAGVMRKEAAVESFEQTFADMMGSVTGLSMVFAAIIAFGVVYNSARISLSERSRELASLRVIGLTRAEISYILLGELAITTLLAVPLGLLVGYGLAAAMVAGFDTEVWRLPLVVTSRTYALSAVTVIASTVVSALIVRRRLDRLDLVEVLKTRE